MSTVVCQGFLEPQLMETTTMRLKVVTPKSLESVKDQSGNWNFLQSSSPQSPKNAKESESLFIQPLDYKQSSILLSEKSLELCTESLGSESGSDTSESSILSLSLLDSRKSIPREERNSCLLESRKSTRRSFPPPLTSISGSNSLQVKPHREGGRLIIQAMEAPSTHTYFQAERSEGRLRLTVWENVDHDIDSNMSSNEECEKSHQEDEVLHVENDMINNEIIENALNKRFQEEGIDYDETVKKITDMKENNQDLGVGMVMGEMEMEMKMKMKMGLGIEMKVEMGMEKFQRETRRRSRCKEDGHKNKGLGCNWEAFWVATS